MNSSAILILDASVLINFLRIDRVDLIEKYPAKIYITDHVVAEVTIAYAEQIVRLNAAIAAGVLEVLTITDLVELDAIAKLQEGSQARLGVGECSAMAIAVHRGFELAIDDVAAVKFAKEFLANLRIHQTADLVVTLIRAGVLDVSAADAIKADWAQNHRFRIKIGSFAEIL